MSALRHLPGKKRSPIPLLGLNRLAPSFLPSNLIHLIGSLFTEINASGFLRICTKITLLEGRW